MSRVSALPHLTSRQLNRRHEIYEVQRVNVQLIQCQYLMKIRGRVIGVQPLALNNSR